jgi:predicted transglutaminase-like cysteine proteinase
MTLDQITTINSRVNAGPHRFALDFYGMVKSNADMQADAITDPADFALVKRLELLDAGMSKADLHLHTCQTSDGAFHAVLLVTVDGAPYVLDHLTDAVIPKSASGYSWHA